MYSAWTVATTLEIACRFNKTIPGLTVTGHAQGLITINIAEADNAWRERMRQDMAEQGQYHRVSYWCLQISLFWGGIWMPR